ncbi:MAG: hypothetical protein LBV40_03685 [Methanomicrobiales archaeon]|jgi:hypothetical protein|nr:hypothetical protein [Methanomicrobiales archaeon]
MKIITTNAPDIWYDADDLQSHTRVIIRKESVTCCGCSGGDFIHCINTPHDLIVFLSALTPQKPYEPQKEKNDVTNERSELIDIQEKWFSALTHCYDQKKGWIAEPEQVIASMTNEIWFSQGQPLIRFSLAMQGSLCEFLTQPFYSDRLHAVLSWWYHNEATPEEKENYTQILQKPVAEMGRAAIARAMNLYNHGTYELTGLYGK